MATSQFSFRTQDWNGEINFNDLYSPSQDDNYPNATLGSSLVVDSFDSFVADESPEIAAGSAFNLPSAITGTILTSANREISEIQNNSRTLETNLGLTSEGHSFLAPIHTEIENINNSNLTSIENSEIAIGSAFGPEGLAAGLAVAGITNFVAPMFQQDTAAINSTSGQLV